MSDPYIGQITMFGGNFAIRNYAFCNGALLQISQNTALFSILGTTFGGDGRTTFGLPDLRGRFPLHVGGSSGTGPGLPTYRWGQKGGVATRTLTPAQMPNHSHNFNVPASNPPADQDSPENNFPAALETDGYHTTADTQMGQGTSAAVGGGQSFNTMNPFLAVNFLIALFGTFPPRN